MARDQRGLEEELRELREALQGLLRRLERMEQSLGGLLAEANRDDHAARIAAARSEVALRRADEAAAAPGRVDELAARLAELERGAATRLDALTERIRSLTGEVRRALLVGGAIDVDRGGTPMVRGEPIALHGWALVNRGAVAHLDVSINSHLVEHVRLGLPRTDVADAFELPDAPVAGFEALALVPEEYGGAVLVVDATAHALDGSALRLESVAVPVRSPSPPAPNELRGSEREDVATLSLRRAASADALRLAVFAHSLDYAGAELRMVDLLRSLADEPEFAAFVVSGRDGPLREELEGLGADVHVTDGWGVGAPERYEAWQAEVGERVHEWGPTGALAITLASFAGVDLAGRLGLSCAWSIHETMPLPLFLAFGFPFEDRVHRYVSSRAEAAFRTAVALVYEADASKRVYAGYGGEERAVVVPPGIDLAAIDDYCARAERPALRSELGIDEEARLLLSVGVLQPRKAQTRLVQAFRELGGEHHDVLLALVGDSGGPYSDGLKELVARSGLEDRVRVVPTGRDVLGWFVAADAFVSPSFEETLPGVIMEAAACQLPILATAVGGIPELIEDGVSGFLCDARDLESLVGGLERLLGAPQELREAVVEAAGMRVRERHDVRKRVAAVREILARMIAGAPAGAG